MTGDELLAQITEMRSRVDARYAALGEGEAGEAARAIGDEALDLQRRSLEAILVGINPQQIARAATAGALGRDDRVGRERRGVKAIVTQLYDLAEEFAPDGERFHQELADIAGDLDESTSLLRPGIGG